ncbi:MAG: SprT-like domain-containing protein [Candidatus Saccharibacteria bacterium]|jgi:hypothetical protein
MTVDSFVSYRDQEWLENLLAIIWHKYFSDVPQTNDVLIIWAKRAKRRLGSIELDRRDGHSTIIKINRLFQDLEVPEYVITATIVHEMTHYAHGFGSPHEQKQQHPHSGGVIRREFAERGLVDLYIQQKRWLKAHWLEILQKYHMA